MTDENEQHRRAPGSTPTAEPDGPNQIATRDVEYPGTPQRMRFRLGWYHLVGAALITAPFVYRRVLYEDWGRSGELFLWAPVFLAAGFVFVNRGDVTQRKMAVFVGACLMLSAIGQ